MGCPSSAMANIPNAAPSTDDDDVTQQSVYSSTTNLDVIPNVNRRVNLDNTVEAVYSNISQTASDRPPLSPKQTSDSSLAVFENKWPVAALIIPFSIAGLLIRIGLQRLETYPGAPIFGLLYAQWVGCVIMGFVAEIKPSLSAVYLPLVGGISSGLCGSITTFSSWQLGIFKAFANYDGDPHSTGKNVLAAISQLLVTLAMSLNGVVFGYHIGKLYKAWILQGRSPAKLRIVPAGFSLQSLARLDFGIIAFGILCWLGVIFASVFAQGQRELAFACVFAPIGALLRWQLSFLNLWRGGVFPIGTFAANIIASIVLAVISLLQSGVPMSLMSCYVLTGLADGFCGTLSVGLMKI
ncbi:uncharacterized protein BYT42DRAFT_567242 [Radiomyces spectabilis]|uniref:uncharacterized protein n=1 Tax=Radiomyces spectabilis TaxID=64574 RepID=UPI00221EC278|nr:uncharacterized protein BYT42DRAFT_567242 [Radiomyces spectabilis]KAI8379054.1 hypothetical protein BYT42DRAFT_567242 [Radiomyces spectabilis]